MADFDEKLKAEAASWRAENAPKGLPTCPNCKLREPAVSPWDGRLVWCLAKPVLPAFCGVFYGGMRGDHCGQQINLALFDPASPYAERLNSTACPLFEEQE